MIDRDVVADLGGFADHHAGRVVDEQPGPRMAPGWMSTPVRIRVISPSVRAATFAPRPHSQWLTRWPQIGVRPWIGEDDCSVLRDGGIAVLGRPYVVPEGREHG